MMAVLLFLAQTTEEVEGWILRLSEDSWEARESAERRLRSMGLPAREALERAAQSADVETRTRVKKVLDVMEPLNASPTWDGEGWPVRIPAGERSLKEFVELLKPQIHCPLEIPSGRVNDRVSLTEFEGEIWPFLDLLCRAHGGLRIALERAPNALRLVEGSPDKAPLSYRGPFRFALERLSLESWGFQERPWQGAAMVLSATWTPNHKALVHERLHPNLKPEIRDVRVLGPGGEAIVGIVANDEFQRGTQILKERGRAGLWRDRAVLPYPPAGVRRFARVQGELVLRFATRLEELRVKLVGDALIPPVERGKLRLELLELKPAAGGMSCVMTLRSEGTANLSVLNPAFDYAMGHIELLGTDGKLYPASAISPQQSTNTHKHARCHFPMPVAPVEARIPLVVELAEKKVPFAFRDVELP